MDAFGTFGAADLPPATTLAAGVFGAGGPGPGVAVAVGDPPLGADFTVFPGTTFAADAFGADDTPDGMTFAAAAFGPDGPFPLATTFAAGAPLLAIQEAKKLMRTTCHLILGEAPRASDRERGMAGRPAASQLNSPTSRDAPASPTSAQARKTSPWQQGHAGG